MSLEALLFIIVKRLETKYPSKVNGGFKRSGIYKMEYYLAIKIKFD
jgi:hypothetical protein